MYFGSCNDGGGRFTIHELSPDLDRVHVTFQNWCGPGGEPVSGEIKIGYRPRRGYDVAPARLRWTRVGDGDRGRTTPLTVLNHGNRPLEVHVLRVDSPDGQFALRYSTCRIVQPRRWCRFWVTAAQKITSCP